MICAIVLAAGRSRRMGAQKLLLPFAGSTVIGHVVDQIATSDVSEVRVVVGEDPTAITEALRERPVTIVRNPEPDAEMLSSVRCGLSALPAGCGAALVALGDQPGITTELVNDLLRAYLASSKRIAVPTYAGQRGHPIVFSTDYRDQVLRNYNEVGLRGLLSDHPEEVLEVVVSSPGAVSDMDIPEDYQRELARLNEQARGSSA
jgi:molybdenum cofactor cytidylyltransferase